MGGKNFDGFQGVEGGERSGARGLTGAPTHPEIFLS